MIDELIEFATAPRVVAFFTLLIGLYLLRDLTRVFFYIFGSSRRLHRRRHRQKDPD